MTEIKSSLPLSCPGVWNFNSRIQTARRHTAEHSDASWPLIGHLAQSWPLIGWIVSPPHASLALSPWSSCGRSHYICAAMTHHRGTGDKLVFWSIRNYTASLKFWWSFKKNSGCSYEKGIIMTLRCIMTLLHWVWYGDQVQSIETRFLV